MKTQNHKILLEILNKCLFLFNSLYEFIVDFLFLNSKYFVNVQKMLLEI